MLSPNVENLIVKFLKKNCYDDFIYIIGYQSRMHIPPSEFIGTFELTNQIRMCNELIIRCKFKSCGGFPGYTDLGEKLYSTLKPVLGNIDKIKIEANFSNGFYYD
jgi:hypothetical protein